jgi:penicillin-binding protein 2
VALAALETGTITEQTAVHCPGYVNFYGNTYHCMETHGTISLHNSIVHSCDSYFFTVGNKLGIDNLAHYADMVGFGRTTGVDLPDEKAGVVPSPTQVLRTQRRKWYAGETLSVAIGQGDLQVTPLQLARAISGLASGGVWWTPHLVNSQAKVGRKAEGLNPVFVKDVVDGMWGVVNENGTGNRAQLPGIDLCGKTGTAQLASLDKAKALAGVRGSQNLKDNAWFVGFAPRVSPEIVVVALFEHGGRGQFASPMVRDVIKAYFDKKVRVEAFVRQQSALTSGLQAAISLGLPQRAN